MLIEQSYPFHCVGTKERIARHCVKAGKCQIKTTTVSRLCSLDALAGVGIFVVSGEMVSETKIGQSPNVSITLKIVVIHL